MLVPADEQGRMRGDALEATVAGLDADDRERLFAIVATCGTTNAGVIDDLAGVAAACADVGVWMHVDGAYGGAGLAAPSVRDRYRRHRARRQLHRRPAQVAVRPVRLLRAGVPRSGRGAGRAHAARRVPRRAAHDDDRDDLGWNPSDFAHHLSRRARGLPFWFSLATYGTDAYRDAVETDAATSPGRAARLIDAAPHLELIMEPELSILLFRRVGWSAVDYQAWSDRLLADGIGVRRAHVVGRRDGAALCIVNPRTSVDDIVLIVDSLA